MKSLIARLVRALGCRAETAPTPPPNEREIARGLANALERAMALGLWEHADRVAASAGTLAERHPALAEALARLRLAQGNFDASLAIVDSCAVRSASLRMLRAVCLLQLGRRPEAHMDLNEWSRRSTAPFAARLLLALLEWRDDEPAAAIESLRRNLRHMDDTRTLTALLLICTDAGLDGQAAIWADRLRTILAWDAGAEESRLALRSLGLAPHAATDLEPQISIITQLAAELTASEPVIPALAEAQCVHCTPRTADLLRRAINHALPELDDKSAAFEAIRSLSQAIENHAAGQLAGDEAFLTGGIEPKPPDPAGRRPDVLAIIGAGADQSITERERAA